MPRTPDRFPGPLEEEEIQLDDRTADGDPTVTGALRRIGDTLRFKAVAEIQQVLKARNLPPGFTEIDLTGVQDGDGFSYDSVTKSFKPGAAGGGLTPASHRVLDQLVHDVAETSFTEVVYSGNQVTDVIIWTDSGKTQKIREESYTYTGNKVTTVVTKQYDGSGTLIPTIGTYTETITYSGARVESITGVLS